MFRVLFISIAIVICINVNSQSDTIKAVNYDKKIDLKIKIGLYFNRIEGYTPFLKEEIVFKHIHDLNVKAFLFVL